MNKFTYLLFILTAVFFIQVGTGTAFFSENSIETNSYHSQTAGNENKQIVKISEHNMDEQAVFNAVPSFRVLFQQVLKPLRERLTPYYGLSNLNMSLYIYSVMFGGGIFLLFSFYASLPNQFCVKINITHESDGKKRSL